MAWQGSGPSLTRFVHGCARKGADKSAHTCDDKMRAATTVPGSTRAVEFLEVMRRFGKTLHDASLAPYKNRWSAYPAHTETAAPAKTVTSRRFTLRHVMSRTVTSRQTKSDQTRWSRRLRMCSSQVCVEPHGEHRQNVQNSVLL